MTLLMPRSCCVPGCKSNYSTADASGFRFPEDEQRRVQWIRAIRREDFKPTTNTVVCAKHFEQHCILTKDSVTRPDGTVITAMRGRPSLTKDACPTIFENQPNDCSEDALSQCDEIAIKKEEEDVCIKEEPIEDLDVITGCGTFVPVLKSKPRSNSDHSEDALSQCDEIGIKEEEEDVCTKEDPIEDFDPVTGYTIFVPTLKSKLRSDRPFLPAQPARADVPGEMDAELLITKVFERPPLWDKRNKNHSNRNVTDKLWEDVSKELDCKEMLVKRKWKYFRDHFAVELGKLTLPQSGGVAGGTETSQWQYFQLLHFLKDVVKPKALTRNFPSVLTKGTTETSLPVSSWVGNQVDDVEDPVDKEEGMPTSPTHTGETPARGVEDLDKHKVTSSSRPKQEARKRPRTQDYNQSVLDIGRQGMQYLTEKSNLKQSREDDDDLLFFKSLLPHVKKIPDADKLTFRIRSLELVQHFAFQVPTTSPLPQSSSNSVSFHAPQVSPYCCESTLSPV